MHSQTVRRVWVVAALAVSGLAFMAWVAVGLSPHASATAQPVSTESDVVTDLPPSGQAWIAKYEGIDGEWDDSDHKNWIELRSMVWGAHKPGGGTTGQSRRRGSAVVEDLAITFEYEKASPKLEEKCLKGAVIPKLEIEMTANCGLSRATYLKYEMKNVMVTGFNVSGDASAGPLTVVVGNNFEEVKVTYTEYDDNCTSQGNIEYEWKVEKGE